MALCRVAVDRQPTGMRLQKVQVHSIAVGVIAGPRVINGIGHHACSHRVEFDIACAGEQVVVIIHRAGFLAAFPECADVAVSGVEQRTWLRASRCIKTLGARVWCGVTSSCIWLSTGTQLCSLHKYFGDYRTGRLQEWPRVLH